MHRPTLIIMPALLASLVLTSPAGAYCVDNRTQFRVDFGQYYPGRTLGTRFKARGIEPGKSQCCNWRNRGCNPSGRADAKVRMWADLRRRDGRARNDAYRRFVRLGGRRCSMEGQASGRFIVEIRNGRWHCRATKPEAVDYWKHRTGNSAVIQIQLHSNRSLCVDSGPNARAGQPVRLVRCASLPGLSQLIYAHRVGTNDRIYGANRAARLCIVAGGTAYRQHMPVVWGNCGSAPRGPSSWLRQTVFVGGKTVYLKTFNRRSKVPNIGPKGGACLEASRLSAGAPLRLNKCRKTPSMRWFINFIQR